MKYLILFLSLTLSLINIQAQEMIDDYPLFGAQVIIEPGQTDSDTKKWFKTMKDNNMSICRIRMFESYMRDAEGNWDFSYNFPYWRTFLTTLGGSAHASWHFTLFERKEYALAMSANSEILRSGAGDIPWLMTELQGGNNTYSGNNAMCPTSEEIAQWLWIILGSEGKGGIFWALNPRASGIEAGEWALLDFQNQPTDRMTMVANVSSCINKNNSLFANAKSMDSKISLIYLKESLWTEEVLIKGTPAETDGRKIGLKNLIGYFKALSEMGLTPQIKAVEEFDFSRSEYKGETIILPHQLAIPEQYKEKLELFVSKGGKLIVDGLTGFFDENVHNVMLAGFPFKDLFGGNISEFRKLETPVYYDLEGVKDIPVIGWQGFIIPNSQTKTVLEKDNKTLATRSKYGHGDAVWVPGLLGLAAWEVNASHLANWLYKELEMNELPFLFKNYEKDVLMKTLKSGDKFITIMVNKSGEERKLEIKQKGNSRLTPSVLFPENKRISNDYLFQIPSEETLVLCWE